MLQREQALVLMRNADLVLACPGSPTYALRVWRDGGLLEILADKLTHGRERLHTAGVEIRDTPGGPVWTLITG